MTAGAALAQNYPNRVIKIIVPFGVGGQPDVVARVFAQHQASVAVRADTPLSTFPVAGISSSPMYLAVGPSVQAKTVAELVVHAKTHPGKLNFAAPTGSPPHLAGEIFKRATGIDITPVHYRSMNQAIIDLLAGQMDIVFDSPAPLAALLRDGKIRALVALGSKRMPELPDVPTMAESGLPDLRVVTWNGLVAPAGTPDAIVAKLNASINDALSSADIRATLAKFSSEPLGGTPQEFANFVASESKKWSEIIRLSGVKID